jgi:predicted dienelactone hydrolase
MPAHVLRPPACAGLLLVLGLAGPAFARLAPAAAAPPKPPKPISYKPGPGPHEVGKAHYDWTDGARQRAVPVTVYAPQGGDGPFPVILFSHGLGGSRDGYEYLGRYWASYGYVVVHVQHLGSDEEVWQGKERARVGQALRQAARNPRVAADRPADLRFVLDKLAALGNGGEPALTGRLDLDRVGVAGHSFGAWTTLAVAGQVAVLPNGREVSFADKRVKAAIAMSAPAPRRKADASVVFRNVKIPLFHMTGTKDDSPIGETPAAERRVPFDHIEGADQYLVTFRGGDHMVFSGRPREAKGGEKDAQLQSLVKMGSIAFWDAYLKDEAEAKAWLSRGGFAGVLGEDGVFEKKMKP